MLDGGIVNFYTGGVENLFFSYKNIHPLCLSLCVFFFLDRFCIYVFYYVLLNKSSELIISFWGKAIITRGENGIKLAKNAIFFLLKYARFL